ncbi:hypothetical protein M378DRAFT_82630, partial [Amanita muscaria Koide BX008]
MFSVHYVPGETNVVADALSRIYSDEPLGVVRAESEYVSRDDDDSDDDDDIPGTSRPVYTGMSTIALSGIEAPVRRSSRLAEAGADGRVYNESK